MAILKIARMGHRVLGAPAEPVVDPTALEVRRLVEDMIDTLSEEQGVGLAAPQVYVPKRVVIFFVPGERAEGSGVPLTVLVNPMIEPLGEEVAVAFEGCLSLPGLTGAVPRWTAIRYRGFDLSGREVVRDATGFHARVVQHECDHLDGILYPMRMTDLSTFGFADEVRRRFSDPDAGDDRHGPAGETDQDD